MLKKISGSNLPEREVGLSSHIIISQITIKNEKDYIKAAGRIKESLRSNKKFFKTSLCKISQVVHTSDNKLLAYHYLKLLKFNENKINEFLSLLISNKN